MAFISGAYYADYKNYTLGIIDDGFTIDWVYRSEDINTDVGGGASPIDGVFRGVEVNISFTLAEWDATAAQAAFWPFDGGFGNCGSFGRLLSTMAGSLHLTRCGNETPVTNAIPRTITFQSAILAPGFSVSTLWANRHRKIPLQMRALPVGLNSTANFQQCELTRLFLVS